MYGSRFCNSNFYSSNYYGGHGDVEEEEVERIGGAGPGSMSGKRRRLLKQIAEEDEVVISFITAFFHVVVN